MEINDSIPGLTGQKKYSPRMGCPNCDRGDKTVRFDWGLALESPESDFGKYAQTLQGKKNLRSGFLYLCPTCPQAWYLDAARETMYSVPPGRTALLEAWASAPLSLPPELFNQASAIGATPAHSFSMDKNYAEVPCKVKTREGKWIDKCLLVFKPGPPLETHYKKARLISDIEELQPSEFALPHPVRFNTSRSKEEKPGQFPTRAETKKGLPLILNGTVNFVDQKGLKGEDIVLASGDPKPGTKRAAVIGEKTDKITYFFGDWADSVRWLAQPR